MDALHRSVRRHVVSRCVQRAWLSGDDPRGVERADAGEVKGEQSHIRFKNGNALNRDGTREHRRTEDVLQGRRMEIAKGATCATVELDRECHRLAPKDGSSDGTGRVATVIEQLARDDCGVYEPVLVNKSGMGAMHDIYDTVDTIAKVGMHFRSERARGERR